MFKLPAKIMKDIEEFARQSTDESAGLASRWAKEKAGIVAFEYEMRDAITKERVSDKQVTVNSPTVQGWRFETGYENPQEEVTPLLQRWAVEKAGRKSPPEIGSKMPVSYKDNQHHQAEGFMRKSVPNAAEMKQILDGVIVNTIRGGTV